MIREMGLYETPGFTEARLSACGTHRHAKDAKILYLYLIESLRS